MRKMWIKSLALSLGLVVTGARAQEGVWRPPLASSSGSAPAPAVSLGKPIAIATSKPGTPASTAAIPAAALGRPVPIASSAGRDEKVQTVSFSSGADSRAPIVRGAAPEAVAPKPMPVGPITDPLGTPVPGMHAWRRADGDPVGTPVSRNGGTETVAPPPSSGGTTLVPPTPITTPPGVVTTPGGISSPGTVITPPMTNGPGMISSPGTVITPTNPFPGPAVINGGPPLASAGPVMTPGNNCCDCAPSNCCGTQGGKCCGGGKSCGSGGGFFSKPWGGLGGGCWGCNDGGCDSSRIVLGVEYLMWWLTGDNTPPLVSASNVNNPSQAFLGDPNSTVLYGGNNLGTGMRSGGRLTAQYWFGDDHVWGLDGSVFFLGNDGQGRFSVQSNGTSVALGRPILNVDPNNPNGRLNLPDAEKVAGPFGMGGVLAGGVNISRESNLWGFDLNVRRSICCNEVYTIDLIGGFRTLGLDEKLTVQEVLTVTTGSGPLLAGTGFVVTDTFSTQNRFYGGQIGVDSSYRLGDFTFGLRGKLAVGSTEQAVQINGSTLTTTATGSTLASGGLLALQGTNIGTYKKRLLGVIPEVGMTVGYDIFDWWRLTVGTNILYWNNVARPGEQVNLVVNPSYTPRSSNPPTGVAAPNFLFRQSDLFAYGVSLGMEFRY